MKNQIFTIYFDEAGRGPLAGPLFIWLICPIQKLSNKELLPFCDSKQISESQRENLFQIIKQLEEKKKLISIAARMTAKEIDSYWMTNALHCAIIRWMIKLFSQIFWDSFFGKKINFPNPLSTKADGNLNYWDILSRFSKIESEWFHIKLIMDGNRDFGLKKMFPFWEIETIVSGDAKIKEIWMASIIAKVSRDRIMEHLPKRYEKYGFEKHKWYGTKLHKEMIKKFWPSDIHRKLFLKWIFPDHKFTKKLPEKF